MSGVNYANSSVHKSDLQLIENYAVLLSGGGGGGGPIPDPLTLNQINVNTLNSANEINTSDLNVTGTFTADVATATKSQILYIDPVTDVITRGSVPTTTVPDPLSVNQINANGGNITTLLGTTISATSSISAPSLSGDTLTLNGLSTATQSQLLYIHPSTNVVTKGSVPTASVPDPLNVTTLNAINANIDNLEVGNQIIGVGGAPLEIHSDINANGLVNTIKNDVYMPDLTQNATSNLLCFNPIGGQLSYNSIARLFFQRQTTITLTATAVNTRTLLPIMGGVAGTDYIELFNQSFLLLPATHQIQYIGTAPKTFYIQTSYAFVATGGAASVAWELVKNTSAVSQARFASLSSALGNDQQDYNVVTLANGDTISFFFSCSTLTAQIAATSQTGLTTSQTKPFQLFVTEL